MQVIQKVAKILHEDAKRLERESLKNFLEKNLHSIEAEIYELARKHGIRSVFELDEKLKKGQIKEEHMRDDFQKLDFLTSRKEDILNAIEEIR